MKNTLTVILFFCFFACTFFLKQSVSAKEILISNPNLEKKPIKVWTSSFSNLSKLAPANNPPSQGAGATSIITKTDQPNQPPVQITNNSATILAQTNYFSVASPNSSRSILIPNLSGEITLLGQIIQGTNIKNDSLELGTKTTGAYQKSTAAGNGITIGGTESEGWTATVGLTNLSSNWNQTGAYDIVLANTNSQLKMLSSNGGYYATLDTGSLSADATYTLAGASGTIITTANISSITGALQVSNNLSDLNNSTTARTNLGLGSLAIQNAATVAISGGSISGITDLAVADGGTGLSTTPGNGQLLLGTGSGYALNTLSTGAGIAITNGSGAVTITNNGVTALNSFAGSVSIAGAGINSINSSSGVVTITGTEVDTLALVTGRGGTTSTALTLSNASNNITAGTLTATSGTIDSVSIGGTTPAAVAATTLANSGLTNLGTGGGSTVNLGNSTGTINFLGDTVLAGNKNFTMSAGTGIFTQSYSNTTGAAATLNLTQTAASGTNTVRGLLINAVGTANSGGNNTVKAVDFSNVSQTSNNTFDGVTLGTGWDNYLVTPTIRITGPGTVTGLAGMVFNSGNFDQSASSGTFSTGTGAVSLAGDTTVLSGKTLTIASADALTVGGTIVPQEIIIPISLSSALVDQTIFVANANYKLSSVKCIYAVAALTSGVLQLKVETGTQAPGSGTSQLTGNINLSSTAHTVLTGTLIGSPTTLVSGDRISIDVGGTLTGLLGSCSVGIKRA